MNEERLAEIRGWYEAVKDGSIARAIYDPISFPYTRDLLTIIDAQQDEITRLRAAIKGHLEWLTECEKEQENFTASEPFFGFDSAHDNLARALDTEATP